jgi:hypothetical protein
MALMDYARQWLYHRFCFSANANAIHDGLDASLVGLDADIATADARTIVGEADTGGLSHWGLDLDEARLPSQTDDQYRGALAAVYQGRMVNCEACTDILAKYGISGLFLDRGAADVFADLAFADAEAMTIEGPPSYAHFVVLYDPWSPSSGQTELDFANRCVNSATNLFRIKGAGVRLTPILPSSVVP